MLRLIAFHPMLEAAVTLLYIGVNAKELVYGIFCRLVQY